MILCKIGIHRPLTKVDFLFTDKVSGKMVWLCTCPCGRKWMSDGTRWWGFKMLHHRDDYPFEMADEPRKN